jgi:hypothetical protein
VSQRAKESHHEALEDYPEELKAHPEALESQLGAMHARHGATDLLTSWRGSTWSHAGSPCDHATMKAHAVAL